MDRQMTAEERFGRPERRQLWARDLRLPPNAPLTYLEEGAAAELRADCQAGHLVCPIPDCPEPRISTRAGSRRDHFFHVARAGIQHAPESWLHYTGKHLVAWWLRIRHPEALVRIDDLALDNGQRPDVLATFPDGQRFAFEVQYAAITAEDWQRRHGGYAAQGIMDIWLFGHTGAQWRPARGDWAEGRILINPAQQALEEAGLLLHWINPDQRTVASRRRHSDSAWNGPWGRRHASYVVDQLLACRIEDGSFITPADRHENKVLAERQAQERAEREAEERAEQERADRDDRRRAIEEREDAEYREKVRPFILARFEPVIGLIEDRLPTDRGIWRHYATWHADLFERCIEGRVGQGFTFREAVSPYMDRGQARGIYRAMSGYLRYLAAAGYVWFKTEGYWIADPIQVRGDSVHPPVPYPASPQAAFKRRGPFRTEAEWEAVLDAGPADVVRSEQPTHL